MQTKANTNGKEFIISNFLDYLEKSETNKGYYICPICNEHKLSIDKTGIKYTCYSCFEGKKIAYSLIQKAKNQNSHQSYPNYSTKKQSQPTEDKDNESFNTKKNASKEVLNFLRATFEDGIKYNIRTDEVELYGETFRSDCIRPQIADKYDFDVPSSLLNECILYLALKNQYDPVKDYLERCKYADILPLDHVISTIFNTENLLHIEYVKKWLIACVARVYEPGCKFDNALVLQGKQGLGKSSFFEIICNGYFSDSMTGKLDTNDLRIMYQSWVVEWAELDGYAAKDYHNKIKPFLTKKTDTYRLPYSKDMVTKSRNSIIVGTTNRDDFLKDSTGERRFWIVPLKEYFNLDMIEGLKDSIWCSAIAQYENKQSWQLSREFWENQSEDNEKYKLTDPWEDILIPYLKSQQGMDILMSEVWEKLQNNGIPLSFSKVEQMRASDILKQEGWHKKRIRRGESRITVWVFDETQSEQGYSF